MLPEHGCKARIKSYIAWRVHDKYLTKKLHFSILNFGIHTYLQERLELHVQSSLKPYLGHDVAPTLA
jgi:hypothetical protein